MDFVSFELLFHVPFMNYESLFSNSAGFSCLLCVSYSLVVRAFVIFSLGFLSCDAKLLDQIEKNLNIGNEHLYFEDLKFELDGGYAYLRLI